MHTHPKRKKKKRKPRSSYISASGLDPSSILLFPMHKLCLGELKEPKCNPRVWHPFFCPPQEEVGKSRPKLVSLRILLAHYVAQISIQDLKERGHFLLGTYRATRAGEGGRTGSSGKGKKGSYYGKLIIKCTQEMLDINTPPEEVVKCYLFSMPLCKVYIYSLGGKLC